MKQNWTILLAMVGLAVVPSLAQAGGSGLNVVIVVNQRSTNSVQLGNYYAEQRRVPAENLLRINWTGGNIEWSKASFETVLLEPLTAFLASRDPSNQVDIVVLSMDIPYRVVNSGNTTNNGRNSTTSVLFYGFKPDEEVPGEGVPVSCSLPDASVNPYAGSELPFRSVTNDQAWLAFMITATNLAAAKAIVDRGAVSDGTFPTQSVFLTKSTDTARNVRYLLWDDAIMDSLVLGRVELVRTNALSSAGQGLQLGAQTGYYAFGMPADLFVPGAMADNLTSYGGELFENSGHTGVTNFLMAGATATYGTVVEPCNWLEKFPSPHTYFYQARGFSIAECYYQSLVNPFQGILVGEPLAAPFAVNASGEWLNLPDGAALTGTTNLTVQVTAADTSRPVQQVDLYLDGKFLQTLTNIAPQPNNTLAVTIAGHAIQYLVPAGATLASVTGGLTEAINTEANTNATRVRAIAHGDRIELQSLELGRSGEAITLVAEGNPGSAAAQTTFIQPARSDFLSTVARGRRAYAVTQAVQPDSYLQLDIIKTNGTSITLSVTNSPGNTNTHTLVQALVNAINANTDLAEPDGLIAEDFSAHWGEQGADFNLLARVAGWPEAQITATLTGSSNLTLTPEATQLLDENLTDLMPRNHLYLTAGVTNLPLAFALETAALADGFHELTAVAYEGSHVRTQSRITQDVRITNSPLAATFTLLVGGSNTLVTTTLQFAVAANTNAISRLGLFGTGGWLAGVTNESSAAFAVAGTNLDVGLHPFYALVTGNDGKQFRTETLWLRLVGPDFVEPAFKLSAFGAPPALSWPSLAGRAYEVFSTTNLDTPFQVRGQLVATNSHTTWPDAGPQETAQFYRVRAVP